MESLELRIGRIVNQHDPQGLLAMDAPGDEYATEILAIRDKWDEADSVDAMHTVVYDVFAKWFGRIVGEKETYRSLSEALYALKD